MLFTRQILMLACGSAALVFLGCQDTEIRSYQAPKPEPFSASPPPPDKPSPPAAPAKPPAVNYRTPAGWKEQSDSRPFVVASFQIAEGDRLAEVSITPLRGDGGGLLENVNRWREQIGLARMDEAQLRKDVREIEMAGAKAKYVDLLGPEAAGRPRQRILGVVAPRGEQTWFVKMWGPADLVAKQKTAFEEFVRSLKFHAGAGADHE